LDPRPCLGERTSGLGSGLSQCRLQVSSRLPAIGVLGNANRRSKDQSASRERQRHLESIPTAEPPDRARDERDRDQRGSRVMGEGDDPRLHALPRTAGTIRRHGDTVTGLDHSHEVAKSGGSPAAGRPPDDVETEVTDEPREQLAVSGPARQDVDRGSAAGPP
jgi:hypothetical protein